MSKQILSVIVISALLAILANELRWQRPEMIYYMAIHYISVTFVHVLIASCRQLPQCRNCLYSHFWATFLCYIICQLVHGEIRQLYWLLAAATVAYAL